ncbi:MAG: TonB-dependent receptor [Blastocatellia bacterium]|nr:TonB-dependent receptor [Blastocatellia bacterium]MCS7158472.1 TonB-dependent receptor [Blastocatellia bacterium]MDW8167847.1 TonB-dependent receptor [Acidobacteriota bacterium]MDW8255882.1 TonB-dependent receptor [Acidobacteriota bacterium]
MKCVNFARFLGPIGLALLIALTPLRAFPQSQATAATLEGYVYDPTGAVVPEVTVTAVNAGTGLTRTVKTNAVGYYVIPLLPPGTYTVTFAKAGFAELKLEGIELRVGDALTVNGTLQPAGIREEVLVTAETLPLIETTRTQPGTVIDRALIDVLPLNGRNWTELVLLTPGVTAADDFGNVSFTGVDRVFNNIQVDGADNNNAYFGEIRGRTRAPFQFSQETVQEFRVANSNFSAEFGRAAGGIVNAITRSGTNEWRGTAFYYIRDDAWNANGFFNNANNVPKPPERRQQFGGNIGGPLIRNKLFWFLNYDHQVRNEPVTVTLGARLESEIRALRGPDRELAERFFRPLVRSIPRDFDQINFFPRLDWQITPNHTLTLTHNFQQFDSRNGVFTTPTTTTNVTGNAKNFTNSYTSVIALNSVLTPTLLNEFRFNFVFDDTGDFANDPFLPQITVSGFNLGGRTFLHARPGDFPGRFTRERRVQWIDNVSIIRGRHTIKAGLDINRIVDRNFFASNVNGTYSFGSVTDFLNGVISNYTQRFFIGDPLVRQRTMVYGFYGQDTFRISSRLTLYYGVRYELQTLPGPLVVNPLVPETGRINEDTNNVAPRLGIALSPFRDGKTVIRAGYGIFYGLTPNLMINDVLTNNNAYSINIFLSGTALAANGIVFPPITALDPLNLSKTKFPRLETPPGGIRFADPSSDIMVFAPDRVNPYTQQANLEIERELFPQTTVSVAYLFTRGVKISRSRNINVRPPLEGPAGVATIRVLDEQGRIVHTFQFPRIGVVSPASLRPNPNFRQINMVESAANSIYHGMAVRINRRFHRGLSLLVSYTLSKTTDDIRNALDGRFTDILDPFDVRRDRGLSSLDERQRLVISGVWQMPFFKNATNRILRYALGNWSVSGIATFSSGRAVTADLAGASTDTDLNEDNVPDDRAPHWGRGAFRGPGRNQIDLSLRKRIDLAERRRLEFIIQAFNVFNRPQFTGVQVDAYDATRSGGVTSRVFTLRPRADFLQPVFGLRARDLQLGVRVTF